MVETPMIWASGGRKEAMELLGSLWATGTPEIRDKIVDALLAGPPDGQLARIEPDERQKSRDRRIFDRLKALERVGGPPLDPRLLLEVERLAVTYPIWAAPGGEQANFASWSEMRIGPDTDYSVDDLSDLSNDALVALLRETEEHREGLLEAWRQLGDIKPEAAMTALETLASAPAQGAADIWEYGLRGLRASAKDSIQRQRIAEALARLSDELLADSDVSHGCADFLDAAAGSQPSPTHDSTMWQLFDRTMVAVSTDLSNVQEDGPRDAVSHAINSSMGRLAEAFFKLLFARSLKVSSRIPDDLLPRINRLLAPASPLHRPARVIAASRLSYLFAVDPDWTQRVLIPSFDWVMDEMEATAVWQGYAWQPRIDEKLWPVLRPHFIATFAPGRLEAIGDMAKTIAQLLMLVGVDFQPGEIPNEVVRNALRAMSDELRSEALSWIASFLAQPEEPGAAGTDTPPAKTADTIWAKRVAPWLAAVWPPEPGIRSTSTSEQFAQIAIATHDTFPDAVDQLVSFMVPSYAYYVLDLLERSSHPTRQPAAVLRLIDAVADRQQLAFDTTTLAGILQRMLAADPGIANQVVFHELSNLVQANPN